MTAPSHDSRHLSAYARFFAMLALSFLAMYVLMYAMVDTTANVYNNINKVYMAGLMAMPMGVVELVLMARMYPDRRLNAILLGACAVLGGLFWFAIRTQAGVTDQQFLRSMIPHHAGAILMCRRTTLGDPDLQRLCAQIVESQQREIDEMKAKLR
ncbi:DUF305 domain-containing protein [Dokdonella sp.]|uniref:DUF305 domain-containing protein n=1 Tax=Dokdonella sp. TaxID=2291710 RepID=UPI002F401642